MSDGRFRDGSAKVEPQRVHAIRFGESAHNSMEYHTRQKEVLQTGEFAAKSNIARGAGEAYSDRNGSGLVSIIIPCFNYGHFLSEALESLLLQTWQNWECIVVDDGSTDNTREVAQLFQCRDSRFTYIHQRNQGHSAARNAGLMRRKGIYIQFLDADDRLEPRKLEKHVAYLKENSNVDIVHGPVHFFKTEQSNLSVDLDKREEATGISGAGSDILAFLVRGNIMVINAPLMRSSVLNNVEAFNRDLIGHEDWDYWIRCGLAGKRFQYLDEAQTSAMVRVHRKSATQDIAAMLTSDLRVRELLQRVPLPVELQKENDYRIGMQLAKIARFHLTNSKKLLGFKYVVSALLQSRLSARALLFLIAHMLPKSFAGKLKSIAKWICVPS